MEYENEKEEFCGFVCKTFDELKDLFIKKQMQYGNEKPLSNFSKGARIMFDNDNADSMYFTALSYAAKHVAHVYNNSVDGDKVDESLKDIAVYCIILLYMVEKNKNILKK